MVEVAVESHKSDATTIGAAVVRLVLADELHGLYLGCARQCAGGERIDECLHLVGIIVHLSAHSAHEVNNVAVELHLLVGVYLYIVAVAAEVVACQVNEHHVFCVFLGVVAQIFSIFAVFLCIAGAFGCAGDGVDVCVAAINAAVCFWRRTEDAERPEVKVEQVWRRINST